MLLAPRHGFVFLAMRKTGSTAIEAAFRPYAQLAHQGGAPAIKHTNYADFQRFLEPYLAAKGWPRSSYEVVCVVREPLDWLSSWWRYRSRKELASPSHQNHRSYAGHVSAEQFAYAYMKGEGQLVARMVRPSEFVLPLPGRAEVDRVFRYDRLDLLISFLREKVGEEVEVSFKNVSPKEREFSLPETCERELREFFAPEYRIYGRALSG
jgi:hypothetical protein